jgi:hypothetical protein
MNILAALLIIMSLCLIKADDDPSDSVDPGDPGVIVGSDCQASDITLGLISTCTCRSGENLCPRCRLQFDAGSGLVDCNAPCGFDNRECRSCNIFFGGLCTCLKIMAGISTGSPCFGSTAWTGTGLPPVWILGGAGNLGARLIASTILNTGLEQLDQIPAPNINDGWTLGLHHIDTKTQALTINSRARRSRNEIHIHLCTKKPGPQVTLALLNPNLFTTFKPVGTWFCKATAPVITPVLPNIDSWSAHPSTDYVDWVANHPLIDTNSLGFGLLTDTNNNYLWQCITTLPTDVTEFVFCS